MTKSFFQQFGHPEGALGWFVGHLMAIKNGERSRWLLSILDAQPGERVLEIGSGPGVDLARLAASVDVNGHVMGIDVSAEMVRQAKARNRDANVLVELGDAGSIPAQDAAFDAAYSTNSVQFWSDVNRGVNEIFRVLKPRGRAVVGVQPMARRATAEDSIKWGDRLRAAFEAAGFENIAVKSRAMKPAALALAMCVHGRRPSLT